MFSPPLPIKRWIEPKKQLPWLSPAYAHTYTHTHPKFTVNCSLCWYSLPAEFKYWNLTLFPKPFDPSLSLSLPVIFSLLPSFARWNIYIDLIFSYWKGAMGKLSCHRLILQLPVCDHCWWLHAFYARRHWEIKLRLNNQLVRSSPGKMTSPALPFPSPL